MNTSTFFLLAAAVLLSSCASPIQSRVEHNPQLFAKLGDSDKQAVQHGEVKEGMTKDAVFLAWGTPEHVSQGKNEGKPFERWHYQDYQPVYANTYGGGVGFSYSGRRRGFAYYDPYLYSGPAIQYVPVEGRSVDFVNGKVTAFLVPGPR